ncbi:MAG: tetratricopeptide repeat protein, partial [Bacteroidia bacterium]
MKHAFVFLLVLSNFFSFSQNRERLDSLLRTEKNSRLDTLQVKHFVKISRQYRKIKPDSAFTYLNKAFALAEKINNRFFLHVYNEKISYLKSKGDLKPVIDTALRALQFAEKFKDDFYTPSFNLELGVLYRKLGNYDKSIMHLLKAIEGAKKINYQNGLYNSYNSLGNTYSQEGVIKKAPSDLNRALQSYQKAFEYIDKKINSPESYSN